MSRPVLPPRTTLGAALRTRRAATAADQHAAAAEIGVPQATLSRLERGKHRPSADTARKLAKWLGWTIEQVLEAADTPLPQG
ncbi:MAG: helix-turn-helix transcriptional regulator [Deltaproteobacteria bacterium]|nr:helix-turn-helix transcriptional regulator [Deltaproteobacteria bacterium]